MRVTYCGNVHPAEDLPAWLQTSTDHAVPVARAVREQGHEFGLGAWWNAAVARSLAGDAAVRERVAGWLDEHDLDVWTLNAFPYGGFHDTTVKTAVYAPHWGEPWRVAYTFDVAAAVAALIESRGRGPTVVPISTLPLGFRVDAARPAMAVNLRVAACRLAHLEQETGVCCVLALEPEPDCMLETVAATTTFLEDEVFAGSGALESVLRRHLGVCVDLCHLAVVGEDPVEAWQLLASRGVAAPKVQVSSCLELRDPSSALDQLLQFDEPRYLHQTGGDSGRLRALDLGEVRDRRDEFGACRSVHTHYHLPVFWDAEGPLGSTRAQVRRFLTALNRDPRDEVPLLEVETYTWTVLDADWRPDRDLVRGLLQELDEVRGVLAEAGSAPVDGEQE